MKKYDIFISYRRAGGFEMAKLIEEKLLKRGYRVFLDVEGLKSGEFNTQLYSVIDGCKDFLLICSPGCLERCRDPQDWVRKEIEHALEKKKNIIPIMINGFRFPAPEELPESLRRIPNYQALAPVREMFDGSIDRLTEYLSAKRYVGVARIAAMTAGILLLAAIAAFLLWPRLPASAIDINCVQALAEIQTDTGYMLNALDKCTKYVNGEIDKTALEEVLKQYETWITNDKHLVYTELSEKNYREQDIYDALMEQARNSPQRYAQCIDFLRWLLLESPKSDADKRQIISDIKTIANEDYQDAINRIFGAFLSIDKPFAKDSDGTYRYNAIDAVYRVETSVLRETLFGSGNESVSADHVRKVTDQSTQQSKQQDIIGKVGNNWEELP